MASELKIIVATGVRRIPSRLLAVIKRFSLYAFNSVAIIAAQLSAQFCFLF